MRTMPDPLPMGASLISARADAITITRRSKVDALVKAGELVWLGKHKKVATFKNARSWIKTYRRNRYGEVITCGMQLVRGGGGF